METNIKDLREIVLPERQLRMIESGWGAPATADARVYSFWYDSGGCSVKAYLAHPAVVPSGKTFPVILWNRGGIGNRGAIDEFQARGMFGLMASWGYVVLASQYRGSDGSSKDEFGGKDVDDILKIMDIGGELPFADSSRMGIEGWSRGGMMTYLTLKRFPKFACAIIISGISNLSETYANSSKVRELLLERFPATSSESLLRNRSAVEFAHELPPSTKYLLLHGSGDDVVSPIQTLQMATLFTNLGYHYRMTIFDDGDHFLKGFRKEVDDIRRTWYDKYLSASNFEG